MKIAHENNIKNNIITNGRNLTPDIIDEIEKYTDYITFSLDDDVNNDLGRGIDHGKHIIELLDYIQHKNITIKLNSIVTRKNIENVKEIINIVKRYKIERWKLFKFISLRGKSIENQNEFEVDEKQYEKLINEINKGKLECYVVECKEEEIEKNIC